MTMSIAETNTKPSCQQGALSSPSWDVSSSGIGYSCDIRLVPEDGGYVAYVAQLRGVHSQGDTEEEARLNIEDALQAALAAYGDSGQEIPWSEPEPPKDNEVSLRILVNA